MSLNRLDPSADLQSDGGRGQLHETLELMAAEIRRLRAELTKVRESDRIVAPVPIEAFPVAMGQIYTGAEGGLEIGQIVPMAATTAPAGSLSCDGSAVSRTTYADLFAKIGTTWGAGDGSTTFNLPDFRRKTLVGKGGTGTATLGNAVGNSGGAETHSLVTSELAAHSHGVSDAGHTHTGPSHTHDLGNHTHEHPHYHGVHFYDGSSGTTANPSLDITTTGSVSRIDASGQPDDATTGAPSTNTTSSSGTGNTGSSTTGISTTNTGSGGAHNNIQPSAVVTMAIVYQLGPSDTIQTLPVAWGQVGGTWRLDSAQNIPTNGVTNAHVVTDGDYPEAVVQVTALNGDQSGNSTENVLVGVVAIPYNFRKWKADGIRVKSKLTMAGCDPATSATITLKVSDPVTAGAYLSETYSRTINVTGGGAIADSDYVDCKLNAEKLGADWRPGYLLRFELVWSVPKKFTSATFEVGFLKISW